MRVMLTSIIYSIFHLRNELIANEAMINLKKKILQVQETEYYSSWLEIFHDQF